LGHPSVRPDREEPGERLAMRVSFFGSNFAFGSQQHECRSPTRIPSRLKNPAVAVGNSLRFRKALSTRPGVNPLRNRDVLLFDSRTSTTSQMIFSSIFRKSVGGIVASQPACLGLECLKRRPIHPFTKFSTGFPKSCSTTTYDHLQVHVANPHESKRFGWYVAPMPPVSDPTFHPAE